MTHLKMLRGACAVLALGSTVAFAQEATRAPADMNKDGIVTRTEYMDYMGKMWDDNHAAMMKSDKMMKKDSMAKDTMKKDAMKKDDMAKKDAMKKDAMKK